MKNTPKLLALLTVTTLGMLYVTAASAGPTYHSCTKEKNGGYIETTCDLGIIYSNTFNWVITGTYQTSDRPNRAAICELRLTNDNHPRGNYERALDYMNRPNAMYLYNSNFFYHATNFYTNLTAYGKRAFFFCSEQGVNSLAESRFNVNSVITMLIP